MDPVRAPHASGQAWSTFLKSHAKDIWACNFLPVVELFFRQVFVFFLIELGSRRIVHFAVIRAPTEVWVAQQLRAATPFGVRPKYLIRNNANKYGTLFDEVAKGSGIEILRIRYRAPRANAICERFLGSVRRECLDQMLIFSERQLYAVTKEDVASLNPARPHQGWGRRFRKDRAGRRVRGNRGRLSHSLYSAGCTTIIAEPRERGSPIFKPGYLKQPPPGLQLFALDCLFDFRLTETTRPLKSIVAESSATMTQEVQGGTRSL
jgi:hypothetical protein